jgi:hypothetical protein
MELAAGSLEEAKPQLVLSAKQLASKHNDSQLARDLITGVYRELCRLITWNENLRNAR